jgi:NAD(P)H-hydrate epimerase
VYINQTGNAGMATAGAGDVLTGIVAALIGQKMTAFDAAVLGVHAHGLAGDAAAEELGRTSLMAIDLLDFLPEAFADMEYDGAE